LSGLPLVEGVLKYLKEDNLILSMPGHKGGLGFLNTAEGKELYENFLKCDITEVDGVDNLHHPEGIIKEAQQLLTKFYGSYKSYFLVNGSTSGNLIMIFSCFNEGDKIIVERNCHRSVFNGIILRKLKPVYVKNIIHKEYNAPLVLDKEHFLQVLDENNDAKGIIVTYPNYYGTCIDLPLIIKEAKKRNMRVLVDSAHGAHFGVSSCLPESAIHMGADMVVTSSHKTLPALTQTSFLHVNKGISIDKVNFYVSSFLSTSPSYMLMCSMDYARFYLENYGRKEYEKLINISDEYRKKINKINGFHILGKEDLDNDIFALDLSRYMLNVNKNYSGHKLLEYLRGKNIQCEMSDNSNIVMIFSPFNVEEDFKKVFVTLRDCPLGRLKGQQKINCLGEIPKAKLFPFEVLEKEKIEINFEKADGRVCAESIVPYPPGVPIAMMGEIIDNNIIDMVRYYKMNNFNILGMHDDNIIVID
jgi:arginine/lysine/ornithine decarboxylase